MKDEFKKNLTEEQKRVLVNKGTEIPFTGDLVHNYEDGTYRCAACGNELFDSGTKFESGSGWPSFYDVIDKGKVKLNEDTSHGMKRTEVLCANCGGHLGHLFDDGPNPTGQRYCINSASLKFKEK